MKRPAALAAGLRRLVAPAGPTTPRGAAAGPQLLTVVAAALIAGQLAILVWHFVPGATRRPPASVAPAAPHAAADVADILRAHLFGAQEIGRAHV